MWVLYKGTKVASAYPPSEEARSRRHRYAAFKRNEKKKIALIKVEWCWTLIDHGYQEFLLHFSSTHVLDFEHDPAGVSTLSHYVAMGVSVAQGDIP